ncbi:hypothetical protein BDR04DRAFT_600437 [Suillus decipiens]|nr:hypothetical protein BDR04DRAFT_600437 [Suillus decipiens]
MYDQIITYCKPLYTTISSRKRPDPLKMYDGVCYQDVEPTPLQKFVRRIFSICANSASCLGSTKAPAASVLGCKTCLK